MKTVFDLIRELRDDETVTIHPSEHGWILIIVSRGDLHDKTRVDVKSPFIDDEVIMDLITTSLRRIREVK